MQIEIKSKEQLASILTEWNERLERLEAGGDLDDMRGDVKQLRENYTALKGAFKSDFYAKASGAAKGSLWSDDTAADMGRYIKALWKKDSGTLREIRSKAAIGTTPLRGDDSTQGGDDLLPTQFIPEILRIAEQSSALMGRVTKVNMTTRVASYPKESTGWSWSWVANESAARSEVSVVFDTTTLTTRTAAGFFSISEECLEDTPTALGRWFAATTGETWGVEFDRLLIDGDVSGASDPFNGILYDSSVNELVAPAGATSIGALGSADFYNTVKKLTTRAKRSGAVWMMAPVVWDEISKLVDANGRPLMVNLAGDKVPMMLAGYPVITSEGAPETAGASVPMLAFGNPRWLLHGDRISMELNTYDMTLDRAAYGLVYFTARVRCALAVGLPAAFARLTMAAS